MARDGRAVRLGYGAGLVVLALVVHLPVVDAYFVGDDFEGILEVVRRGSFGSFEHVGGNFRPVAWLTLTIDHWLHGNDPTGYHVFNIVAHGLNGVLVAIVAGGLFGLLQPMMPPDRRRQAAALAGVVFVVLPSHTEAVSWIAGRGDVVMTTGCLVAVAAWVRWLDGGRPWWRAASCGALALALLTKESAVAVPVVVAMLEATLAFVGSPERTPRRERLAAAARAACRAWSLGATVLGFLLVRRVVRGNFVDGYGDQFESSGVVRFVGKTLVAVARSLLPGMPLVAWVVAAGAGVVAGSIGIVAARTGRGRLHGRADVPLLGFLVAAVVVCVLPMVPSGVNATNTGGERLVYLPSAFAVIAVGWLLARLIEVVPRVGVAATVVVIAVASVALVVVDSVWVEAGEASEQLVADAAQWRPDERLVVLNSPDTLRGAYVARNAMAGSMALIHGWAAPQVDEVAGVRVTSATDRVSVEPGSCDRCLVITLLEPDSSFVRVATAGSEWAIDGVVATVQSDRRLEVRFEVPATGPDYDIWYLDEGRLVRADLGA